MNWQDRIDNMVRVAKRKYGEHKANAARRGILFTFSYDEWVAWWVAALGPDWLARRGCSKGKYCMARRGDAGPYAPENVLCILHGENVSDAASNDTIAFGESAGHARLDVAAVQDIFLSTDRRDVLAARYRVSLGTICGIRARHTWRRATAALSRKSLLGRNQWV
jgi:hypothetical protein